MLRYVLEPGAAQRPEQSLKESVYEDSAGRDGEAVLEALRRTTIGADEEVKTPFGLRRLVYTDYTASGRASTIVEDFIRNSVLPRYGNTHTLTTATARQTTYLRAEAREVIRHHLNATHEDAVIFAGNGSTGAAHLLVQTLQRASFSVGRAQAGAPLGEGTREMHYREDRWGGGECTLCGVRVKSAAIFQAHQHSEAHRSRLRAVEDGGTGSTAAAEGRAERAGRRVVVLADAVSHHSSSLPFRELLPQHPLAPDSKPALGGFSGSSCRHMPGGPSTSPYGEIEVELSTVPVDTQTGLIDEAELRARLEALRAWRGQQLVVICVLAAASNVTGLAADVPRITASARAASPEAVICWDFAAALGHAPCNLNPPGDTMAAVDAAFFSPHKLWGGPGGVGVLAVKKRLLCNAVPAVPGGGVVFYVSDEGHSYIQNSEEREEAGTPNILGCIRAGLAFHLLDQMPPGAARAREELMLQRALGAWRGHPRIDLLGPCASGAEGAMTGVVSFMIRYGNASPGLYLHYNYVAALLNDLFGIQARGGCACAGPYAQWLLGIASLSEDFEQCLKRTAQEVLRPGFVRVGLHWAMSEEDVDALITAVQWVADNGWRLLAAYTFDRETGEWLHRLDVPERRRVWLSNIRVAAGDAAARPIAQLEGALGLGGPAGAAPRGSEALIAAAEAALREAYSSAHVALSSAKWPALCAEYAHLLWFALPADVAYTLRSQQPDRPQLLAGDAVFAAGEQPAARPEHSVLDGAAGVRRPPAADAGDAAGADDDWEPLDSMVPEDADEADAQEAEAAKGPTFSRCQLRPSIPKPLRGMVGKAIADYGMINEGDRLLVGLSGGKDSLAVLHILLALRRSAPIRFEIAAATVDPQTPEFNPWPLVPYLKALDVEYHMLSKPIIEMAKKHMDPKRPSLCAFCSRMKRGLLYSCMREKGYNVLVLGQHLDDFAESFFMSAIHNGLLRTMKANYWVRQEDVRVCRPLLYVREKEMAMFAKENQLPVIADNCPACFAAPKERHKTKVLLSSLEFDYPALFSTLLRTMQPLYALGTADRGDGVLAGDDDEDAPRRAAGGEGGRRVVRVAPRVRDVADDDAAAELVLSACGPSAAGDAGAGDASGAPCCALQGFAAEPPPASPLPPPSTAGGAGVGALALAFAAGAACAVAVASLASRPGRR